MVRAKTRQRLQKKKGTKKRKEIRSDVITRRAKEILLGTDDHIWMCPICKLADGSCKYAICDGCHGTHLDKRTRRQKDTKLDLAGNGCRHKLDHLVHDSNIWWWGVFFLCGTVEYGAVTSRGTVRSLFFEPMESLTLYLVMRFSCDRVQIVRKCAVLPRSKHTRATCRRVVPRAKKISSRYMYWYLGGNMQKEVN